MFVVPEACLEQFQLPGPFDVDLFAGIHQNVGDGRILQEGFQGPESQHLVLDFLDEPVPLTDVQQDLVLPEDLFDEPCQLRLQLSPFQRGDDGQIHQLEHALMDARLQLVILRHAHQ